jgi:O-antigen/teichoic acid export membrane protein
LRALQNITVPFPHFVTAMGLLFLPRVSSAFSDRGAAGVRKMVGGVTALFACGAAAYLAFILVFGKSLMEHLYGGKYRNFEHLLPMVGLYLVINAAGQGLVLGLRGMQAASEVFVAYLGAAAVTVAAGVACTRIWGLAGAVNALLLTSVAFVALLVVRYVATLRRVGASC